MLLALAAASIVIGISKTAFGGIAAISVAVFALAVPARESTATVLLLLILADIVAVSRYRKVSVKLLLRLIPGVLPGLILGAVFIRFVDDSIMKRAIGALLLITVLLQLWRRRHPIEDQPAGPPHWAQAGATGVAAGFTTMTANAAGPVMALYFLAARIDKARFIGTNAWFFFLINLTKVPLAASLNLFTAAGLMLDLVMVPFVLLGTVIGVWLIKQVSQQTFEKVTLVGSAIASLSLLIT